MEKDKKIGILTFHNVPNYGAVLQCMALKSYIEKCEIKDVRVIDYINIGNGEDLTIDNISNNIKKTNNMVKRIAKQIIFALNKSSYSQKLSKFADFRNNFMNLDSKVAEVNNNYDIIIYGSDQIWNPEITKGYDNFYYAKNIENKHIVIAAFAASCGDVDIVKEEKEFIELMSNFHFISTREDSLSKYINSFGKKSVCVLDPTFLLSKNEYLSKLQIAISTQDEYIFVYELQKNSNLMHVAKKIANRTGLKIKKVCGYLNNSTINMNGIFDAGPKDFLELLANAKYVVTNSFHGVTFSMIFNINFYVVLPKSRTSRITELLNKFDLTERILLENDMLELQSIDFIKLNSLIEEKNIETKKYLSSIFKGVK